MPFVLEKQLGRSVQQGPGVRSWKITRGFTEGKKNWIEPS